MYGGWTEYAGFISDIWNVYTISLQKYIRIRKFEIAAQTQPFLNPSIEGYNFFLHFNDKKLLHFYFKALEFIKQKLVDFLNIRKTNDYLKDLKYILFVRKTLDFKIKLKRKNF